MINIPHWIVAAFVGTCALATCIVLFGRMYLAFHRVLMKQEAISLEKE